MSGQETENFKGPNLGEFANNLHSGIYEMERQIKQLSNQLQIVSADSLKKDGNIKTLEFKVIEKDSIIKEKDKIIRTYTEQAKTEKVEEIIPEKTEEIIPEDKD